MSLTKKILSGPNGDEVLWFRELTAGEQLELTRGARLVRNKDGTADHDFGANLAMGQQLVQKTLVTEEGEKVYRNMDVALKEGAKRMNKLIKLATEVLNEEEPAGK